MLVCIGFPAVFLAFRYVLNWIFCVKVEGLFSFLNPTTSAGAASLEVVLPDAPGGTDSAAGERSIYPSVDPSIDLPISLPRTSNKTAQNRFRRRFSGTFGRRYPKVEVLPPNSLSLSLSLSVCLSVSLSLCRSPSFYLSTRVIPTRAG